MAKLNIYLNFNGTTEKAFNFYKSVFGGEFSMFQRFKEVPPEEKMKAQIKDKEGENVMHVSLPIGQDTLMASDVPESMGKSNAGNNFSIYVEVKDKTEADKIFTALSKGGKINMPLADTFWGAYYGMVEDQFGIRWMVGYTYPKK